LEHLKRGVEKELTTHAYAVIGYMYIQTHTMEIDIAVINP